MPMWMIALVFATGLLRVKAEEFSMMAYTGGMS